MKFPTLHCVCPDAHTWAILIPVEWYSVKDIQCCPFCSKQAEYMRAGDWKDLDVVKKEQEDHSCTKSP